MSDFSKALTVSAKAMQAQATRMRHVSENMANSDTPGYRRKTVSFLAQKDPGTDLTTVEVGRVRLDRSELNAIFDPAHPLADEDGRYDGSNVNILVEMADAREARRSYEANLKLFEQARQMSSSLMELLRK